MNYMNYCNCDLINGNGMRCVLWVTGCTWGCEGCFQHATHNPNNGTLFDENMQDKILKDLDNNFIKGLTWTGGDPLHKRNVQEVINFSKRIKDTLPDKDIWLYTGYTLQQIIDDELRAPILSVCDYVVDGKFVKELSGTPKAQFRGSRNQRIYRVIDGVPELDERFNFNS